MPGVGFPRSPQDTRKTQDTPIPAVLGKTLTDYHELYSVSMGDMDTLSQHET